MAVVLHRIDDRLIHGQVVVGWGQPLGIGFIALVDDAVAASDWEQDLYRMGVPNEMTVSFSSVDEAVERYGGWEADSRQGILLTGDVATMRRLAARIPSLKTVNVGGIHHRAGRAQRLRFVFLTPEEAAELRELAASGVGVSAQDLPSGNPVPLEEFL